jgi:hypothetical protein
VLPVSTTFGRAVIAPEATVVFPNNSVGVSVAVPLPLGSLTVNTTDVRVAVAPPVF